jgi:magnesium transporter
LDALAAVRASSAAASDIQAVYLADARERLAGAVALASRVRAAGQQPVRTLAAREPPAVAPEADTPEIVRLMSDYDLLSLPVLDVRGRAIGVGSLDDVVARLLPRDLRWRWGDARA